VDTQPFPVNIVELASKKSLDRPKVADKAKGKTSSLVIIARRMVHEEWLLRRLQTRRQINQRRHGARAIG
jgi:hypothetical protein